MKGILCFGDSITFGQGEIPCFGWCGRLKNYFEPLKKHQIVYNLGIPGQTSTELLERFDIEAKTRIRLKRDGDVYILLIAIGTNDCKFDGSEKIPRTTSEEYTKNIQELILKAKKFNAKIAFLGLPPVDESKTSPYEETWFTNNSILEFNNIIKKESEENNIPFLDIYNIVSSQNHIGLLEDGLHPNSKGYDFMFEKIKEFLEINQLI